MQKQVVNPRNVYILSFTLLVLMLGFGVVIPIMPFYVQQMGASGTELGLLVASYAVTRLICGPFWGSLSDRIGRKPVLMIGVFGYAVTMFLFGLATELWMLFASRALAGVLSSAATPTAMAYISDSTGRKERGGGMGKLGAAIGLGTILGPGLGGLLSVDSLATPFFIAGGMALLALALVALLLPESLPQPARKAAENKPHGLSLAVLAQSVRGPLGLLMVLSLLVSYALTTFSAMFGLFTAERFAYGPQEVGVLLMVMGGVSVVAQGFLAGPLTSRWGETPLIKIALAGAAAGFAWMALAVSTTALLGSTALITLATGLLSPALSALISKRATLEQGAVMGINEAFVSLGRIAGPLGSGLLFDLDTAYPFWSGALAALMGLVAAAGWSPEHSYCRPNISTARQTVRNWISTVSSIWRA